LMTIVNVDEAIVSNFVDVLILIHVKKKLYCLNIVLYMIGDKILKYIV